MKKMGQISDVIFELDKEKTYLIAIKEKEFAENKFKLLCELLKKAGIKALILPMDDPSKLVISEINQVVFKMTGKAIEAGERNKRKTKEEGK